MKVFFKDCSKLGVAEFRLIDQLTGLKSPKIAQATVAILPNLTMKKVGAAQSS